MIVFIIELNCIGYILAT